MKGIASLLVVAMLLPVVAAQEPDAHVVATDASGDVQVTYQGATIPNGGRFQNLDIISIAAAERADFFIFDVEIASGEDVTLLEYGEVWLDFAHHDQRYRIVYDSVGLAGFPEPVRNAMVHRHDPVADQFNHVAFVPSTLTGNVLSANVPRELLIDSKGAAPFPGRQLIDFQAYAHGFLSESAVYLDGDEPTLGFAQIEDWGPETPSTEILEVTMGLEQTGHIRLATLDPMRASNGEETTFVYELSVTSMGRSDDVRIDFLDVPAGWTVEASNSIVHVEDTTTFLVRVDIPFAHKHGAAEAFRVEATSIQSEDAVGRVDIGVYYLDIPQPSGHHNTLYMHTVSRDDNFAIIDQVFGGRGDRVGFPFMNAVEEYDQDDNVPASPGLCGICIREGNAQYEWTIPLAPSLRLGVDMNMSQLGAGLFEFSTAKPLFGAAASGQLIYFGPDVNHFFARPEQGTPIAMLEPLALGDMGAFTTATYEPTVTPHGDGDYIPYERGGNLMFFLTLTSTNPGIDIVADQPLLEAGGWLRLPLDEYADTVADLSGFVAPAPTENELDSFSEGPEESKKSPASALLLPLALMFVLRRRH